MILVACGLGTRPYFAYQWHHGLTEWDSPPAISPFFTITLGMGWDLVASIPALCFRRSIFFYLIYRDYKIYLVGVSYLRTLSRLGLPICGRLIQYHLNQGQMSQGFLSHTDKWSTPKTSGGGLQAECPWSRRNVISWRCTCTAGDPLSVKNYPIFT